MFIRINVNLNNCVGNSMVVFVQKLQGFSAEKTFPPYKMKIFHVGSFHFLSDGYTEDT